jgi:hypothetical protein
MMKSIRFAVKTTVLSLLFFVSVHLLAALPHADRALESENKLVTEEQPNMAAYTTLYNNLHLEHLLLSKEAFLLGVQGFQKMIASGTLNKQLLSIVDFSLPSDKKRLFVIDLAKGKLLFNTYVAHGRNSGEALATSFSNDMESYKSSLGFYVTGNTYRGEHGYSLRLDGIEKGINDNAYNRKIVIHGARYVNEKMIAKQGYIGRSLGCPALPQKLYRPIIEKIREGSCLFLYSPDHQYTQQSALLSVDSLTSAFNHAS